MGRTRLTEKSVRAIKRPVKGSAWAWDSEVPGLGVRVLASGVRSYVFRWGRGRRGLAGRVTIAQVNALSLELARAEARLLLGARAAGRDPGRERAAARAVPTLAEFSREYLLKHAEKHKRPASVARDRELFRLHLVPALGSRPLDQITRGDVASLHRAKYEIPTAANHCLALLSHVYTIAHRWGVYEGANPVAGVVRYPMVKRERYLSASELQRVGAALGTSTGANALRLLLLTGARRGEVLGLKWEQLDLKAGLARLDTRKAGGLLLTLPAAAVAVLESMLPLEGNPYVFPGDREGKPMTGNSLSHAWRVLAKGVGLEDVRLHDLRHTFASVLAGRGASLPIIGALLGHSQSQTTARYAHLADGPLRLAADGAADAIAEALRKK